MSSLSPEYADHLCLGHCRSATSHMLSVFHTGPQETCHVMLALVSPGIRLGISVVTPAPTNQLQKIRAKPTDQAPHLPVRNIPACVYEVATLTVLNMKTYTVPATHLLALWQSAASAAASAAPGSAATSVHCSAAWAWARRWLGLGPGRVGTVIIVSSCKGRWSQVSLLRS